ncbi:(4Fe-4S)-binding protein [Nocardia sp. NPDC004151]|uniref:(4Fe-4S)-binding protein n=1 Tax=Nocardia sp. NPDC004151 TaxID=3364304 RepID=UPI0036976BE9
MPHEKSDAIREYSAPGVTITWEPGRCRHAQECVHGLPSVFDRDRRPWIDPSAASVDDIVDVIDRCPSYALGYRTGDGRTRTAPPA